MKSSSQHDSVKRLNNNKKWFQWKNMNSNLKLINYKVMMSWKRSDDELEMKWWWVGNEVMTILKWSDQTKWMKKWFYELWLILNLKQNDSFAKFTINTFGWFDMWTVYSVQFTVRNAVNLYVNNENFKVIVSKTEFDRNVFHQAIF